MDPYNPLFQENVKDVEALLQEQNIKYGAQVWYPLMHGTNMTPDSVLLALTSSEIALLKKGEVPDSLRERVEPLLTTYQFMKTTHKSSHQFRPITNYDEFVEEITEPDIIMSFRRYSCGHLLFRKYVSMSLECRVYVYQSKVRYMECYRDVNNEFVPEMFLDMLKFVEQEVIPALASAYDNFTPDIYFDKDKQKWNCIEINSPVWLKAGMYHIDYEWNRDLIHTTEKPLCRYRDSEMNVLSYEL